MSSTWWRVAALNHQTQYARTVALVRNEYAARRMQKYAAAWVDLTEEERLEVWEVQLDLTDTPI